MSFFVFFCFSSQPVPLTIPATVDTAETLNSRPGVHLHREAARPGDPPEHPGGRSAVLTQGDKVEAAGGSPERPPRAAHFGSAQCSPAWRGHGCRLHSLVSIDRDFFIFIIFLPFYFILFFLNLERPVGGRKAKSSSCSAGWPMLRSQAGDSRRPRPRPRPGVPGILSVSLTHTEIHHDGSNELVLSLSLFPICCCWYQAF